MNNRTTGEATAIPFPSHIEWLALRQYDEHCCHWYCHYCLAPLLRPGEPFEGERDTSRWMHCDGRRFFVGAVPPTLDHIVPRSTGGCDDDSNLVLCCGGCNSSKGNRPAWMFEAIIKEWLWRNRHFMVMMHDYWAAFRAKGMSDLERQYNLLLNA